MSQEKDKAVLDAAFVCAYFPKASIPSVMTQTSAASPPPAGSTDALPARVGAALIPSTTPTPSSTQWASQTPSVVPIKPRAVHVVAPSSSRPPPPGNPAAFAHASMRDAIFSSLEVASQNAVPGVARVNVYLGDAAPTTARTASPTRTIMRRPIEGLFQDPYAHVGSQSGFLPSMPEPSWKWVPDRLQERTSTLAVVATTPTPIRPQPQPTQPLLRRALTYSGAPAIPPAPAPASATPAAAMRPEGAPPSRNRKNSYRPSQRFDLRCEFCLRTSSPEWRRGPSGPNALCNACGIKWAKKNKTQAWQETVAFTQYTPVAAATAQQGDEQPAAEAQDDEQKDQRLSVAALCHP